MYVMKKFLFVVGEHKNFALYLTVTHMSCTVCPVLTHFINAVEVINVHCGNIK
jgi:hypothetical protein